MVDLFGRTVTIPDKPEAIVAISPTATELVYAVGGTIIGRSQSVNYPPEAAEAPSIGTAYQPNFEAILALEPDLVVADSTIHIQPAVREALEALGVPVIFAGAASVDEVLTGLTLLGEVLDNPTAAADAVAVIEAARAGAQEVLAGAEVSAVIIIGDRDRSLYGAKATSYGGSILAALGITNPASDLPDSGPFPGFTRISPETMLEFDPRLHLHGHPGPAPGPRASAACLVSSQACPGSRRCRTGACSSSMSSSSCRPPVPASSRPSPPSSRPSPGSSRGEGDGGTHG